MNSVTPSHHIEEAPQGSSGPGRLLRSARESAGISIRDVSAQLRLDERTVIALESDDFSHLPAPTFVRGYLRGYARLMGVPVGPVMEAYDREGFGPPGLVADISEAPQANASDFPVRITTIAVVVVLAVLVIMWWNNQAFDDLDLGLSGADPTKKAAARPASPEDKLAAGTPVIDEAPRPETRQVPRGEASGQSPEAPAMESPLTPGAPAPAATAPDTSADAVAAAPVEQVIARAESVLEQTRGELDAMGATVTGDALQDMAPTTTESSQVEAPPPATATAQTAAAPSEASTARTPPAAEGAATPDVASGNARLIIEFPIEAWVEVYDRDDSRLYYNLVKPGRTLDLSGPPPVRVLLGRTAGVSVTYNGDAVDLAPYTEKGVARFTLGR